MESKYSTKPMELGHFTVLGPLFSFCLLELLHVPERDTLMKMQERLGSKWSKKKVARVKKD
jgi:hypothetical protein